MLARHELATNEGINTYTPPMLRWTIYNNQQVKNWRVQNQETYWIEIEKIVGVYAHNETQQKRSREKNKTSTRMLEGKMDNF